MIFLLESILSILTGRENVEPYCFWVESRTSDLKLSRVEIFHRTRRMASSPKAEASFGRVEARR